MNTRTALRAVASAAALASLAFGLTGCGDDKTAADGMYFDNDETAVVFDGIAVTSFEVACGDNGKGLAAMSKDPVATGELNGDGNQLIWRDREAQDVSVSATADIVNIGGGQYTRMEEKDILSAMDADQCSAAAAASAAQADKDKGVEKLEQDAIAASAPLSEGSWYSIERPEYGEVVRLTIAGSTVTETYLLCGADESLGEGKLGNNVIDWTTSNGRGKRSVATVDTDGSLTLGIEGGDIKPSTFVAEDSVEVKAAAAAYEKECGSPITG